MKARIKLILLIIVLLAVLFFITSAVSTLFFNGKAIPCLFFSISGLQCPGCGTWRMLSALQRLDLKAAISYNAAVFLSIPLLTAVFGFAAAKYIKNGEKSFAKWQNYICFFVIMLLLVNCVLRNIF